MQSKSLTMEEVARLSGVSIATVSRVFSNPEKVKAETREKVQKIIDETGFIPNAMASTLSSRRSRSIIGVVVDEIANPFFMELIAGLETIVQKKGYSLTFFSTDWDIEKEIAAVESLIKWRVEGVLLTTLSADSRSIQLLKRNKVPYVLMNSRGEVSDISVVADNYAGGTLVAELFSNRPCEQNLVVTGMEDLSLNERMQGFFDRAHNYFPYAIERNVITYKQGYEITKILVAKYALDKIKTNLWVTNDNVAIAVMLALRELKISIPDQVAIIGFDNIYASNWCHPSLTTIEQPSLDMGKLAINLLLGEINDEDVEHKTYSFPTKIIYRESF